MSKKEIHSKVKKLRFGAIIKKLREDFSKLIDSRQSPEYPIEDVVMSVFAMMFFQNPSMLKYQERLLIKHNKDNLKTLFGVKNIPSDGTIRNVNL